MNPRPQRPARYAVAFRIGLGARAAGALVIDQDGLQLEGRTADGPVELSVPYAELVEVRIGRDPEELVNGRPALLLARQDGPPVQVVPFGIGLLHELADLLVALATEHADSGEEVAVIVPLKKDRMIYYVSGNFGSRKGISVGSVTLHPSGLPHGPQPGLAEKSLGVAETTELAVMCDTFRPLKLSTLARDLDDGHYALSWYEPPSEEPSLAGVTSHL